MCVHACTHAHTHTHTHLEGSRCICITDTTIAAATVTKRNSSYKESVPSAPQLLTKAQPVSSEQRGMSPRETSSLRPGQPGVLAASCTSSAWGSRPEWVVCCPQVGLAALEDDAILGCVETRAGLRGLALAQDWILWLQLGSLPFLTKASQVPRETA